MWVAGRHVVSWYVHRKYIPRLLLYRPGNVWGERNGRNVKECVAVDETIRHDRHVPILELLNMPTLSACIPQ